MKPLTHVGIWICAGALSACTAGTSTAHPSPAPSFDAAVSSIAASADGATAFASAGGGPKCEGLATTATTITATVDKLSLLVGTSEDPASILSDLGGFAPALGGLVPLCEPAAEDSMWRFLTAVEDLRQRYQPGKGETALSADRLSLVFVRARGADLYRRLALDASGWEQVPVNARVTCADLAGMASPLTIAVRELGGLIGAGYDNDTRGFLVDVAGLTAAVSGLVAECRPKADAAMAKFQAAVDRVTAGYQFGSDPTSLAENKAALDDVRATGIALYELLGLSTGGWTSIRPNAR